MTHINDMCSDLQAESCGWLFKSLLAGQVLGAYCGGLTTGQTADYVCILLGLGVTLESSNFFHLSLFSAHFGTVILFFVEFGWIILIPYHTSLFASLV